MKKQLSTSGTFKKALERDGVIVVHRRYMPTEKKTRIHRPACWCVHAISVRFSGGWQPRKKQQYWHYDAYETARQAYPDSRPCGLCRPDKA